MSPVRRVLAGLVAGLAIAMVPVAGAVAAPTQQDVAVSLDGVNFTATPTGSLFDGLTPLVPGGSAQRTLWVRNDGTSTVVMRINATDVTVSEPAYGVALTIAADSSTGRSMSFATTETCYLLVGEQYLGPRQVVAVTFDISLSAGLVGTAAQLSDAHADLVVGMRDAAAPAPADGDCDGVHLPILGGSAVTASSLSTTGANPLPWLAAALALVAGGSLAASSARERRRDGDRATDA